MYKRPVLWRSAFQAHRSRIAYPRTSSPVTIATLCSAFQALSIQFKIDLCTMYINDKSLNTAFYFNFGIPGICGILPIMAFIFEPVIIFIILRVWSNCLTRRFTS